MCLNIDFHLNDREETERERTFHLLVHTKMPAIDQTWLSRSRNLPELTHLGGRQTFRQSSTLLQVL